MVNAGKSCAVEGDFFGAPIEKGGRWRGAGPGLDTRSLWPDDRELPLLRALVGPETEAGREWRKWCDAGGFEQLSPRTQQLLPTCRLLRERLAPRTAELAFLKRAYLSSWANNQRLFERLRTLLEALGREDCPGLVLKGAALAPIYYGDLGARSMGDVDLLVPEHQFPLAMQIMMANGWRPLHYRPELFDTRFCHAIPMLNDRGAGVDLHCHVISQSCEVGADRAFWEQAVRFNADGVEATTLCTTDHLMHACAHGVWWVRDPPLRWIVDVVMILRSRRASIDWTRVGLQAKERGVGLRVGRALRFLFDLGLEVPVALAEHLISEADWIERRRLRLATSSSRGRPTRLMAFHWMMYRRGLKDRGAFKKLAGLADYLRFSTQSPSATRIPLVLAEKGVKSIAHRFGFYRYWNSD